MHLLLIIILVLFLWYTSSYNVEKFNLDDILTRNYHKKQKYSKRLVLIIESFDTLDHLLTLLRNILKQDIKVNSIVLISENQDLKNVQLIQNTCILNNIGGMSFLLKESSYDTILIFIFSEGFYAFSEPTFLNHYLVSDDAIDGIVKVDTGSVDVDIRKIY
jgi:hypothetical protein